jgi:hypothetical protein
VEVQAAEVEVQAAEAAAQAAEVAALEGVAVPAAVEQAAATSPRATRLREYSDYPP